MISHVLFDFGGVVIDHTVPQALPVIFEKIGAWYEVLPREVRAFWNQKIDPEYMAGNMTYDEVLALHEKQYGKPFPENSREFCIAPMEHAVFHQEIEHYIYTLKAQWYVVCLLSDMSKERKDLFTSKDWYRSFDVLFNSCDIGYSKAKDNRDDTTNMYNHVLKELWVSGEQCLFIDDKQNNCLQANAVWIHTIQAFSPQQTILEVNEFLEKNR